EGNQRKGSVGKVSAVSDTPADHEHQQTGCGPADSGYHLGNVERIVDQEAAGCADRLVHRQPKTRKVLDRKRAGCHACAQFRDFVYVGVRISVLIGKEEGPQKPGQPVGKNQSEPWQQATCKTGNFLHWSFLRVIRLNNLLPGIRFNVPSIVLSFTTNLQTALSLSLISVLFSLSYLKSMLPILTALPSTILSAEIVRIPGFSDFEM